MGIALIMDIKLGCGEKDGACLKPRFKKVKTKMRPSGIFYKMYKLMIDDTLFFATTCSLFYQSSSKEKRQMKVNALFLDKLFCQVCSLLVGTNLILRMQKKFLYPFK